MSNTAMASAPATFFVSSAGNDRADGSTPQTAWATIDRLNSVKAGGFTALFRRGDTFYGELVLPFNCEVGAYGIGPKPILTMLKLLNRPTGWTQYSPGVWKINLGSPETHDGYTGTVNANIGYLLVDGLIKPAKKETASDLGDTWDFWCDTAANELYVAAAANPTVLAGDIQAAPLGSAHGAIIYCNKGSNKIRDLHITGTGGCGIRGAASDVQVLNCLIDSIGGSFLPNYKNGLVRYGNAINNDIGSKRWLIDSNEITQVYDVAYSCQGQAYATSGTWEDMVFRNNYIHHCTQSFEFWSQGTNPRAGFRKILIERNLCEYAGFSDFAKVRPNQTNRVHILTYEWELPADVLIQDNVFDQAYSAYTYQQTDPVGLESRNNQIRMTRGTKIQFQRTETVEQAAVWQAATGQENGSIFTLLP